MIRRARDGYVELRGPTGDDFARWRAGRSRRYAERFAVKGIGGTADDRRKMRNARKREHAS